MRMVRFNIMKKIFKNIFGLNKRFSDKVEIMDSSIVDKHCDIGEYTYIGHNNMITKTKIGRYCSIANNCAIGQGEHDISKVSTSSLFYEGDVYAELTKGECVLGNDVWICQGVVIRRGVKIGNGAVIGANSFVNKDIPDFAIAVGSPAKVVKYRFDEEKQKRILDSKWWDLDLENAKEVVKGLN